MTQLPPIAYMTPAGDFAASCEVGTPPPHPDLIPAPDGGGYGMHWDGSAWEDDPGADARVHAYLNPEAALAEERAAMAVDRWQMIAALDLTDAGYWPTISAWAEDPSCDPVTRSAIRNVQRVPRVSEMVDFFQWLLHIGPEQTDAIFRLAATIRG